jgi:hypothetical protein
MLCLRYVKDLSFCSPFLGARRSRPDSCQHAGSVATDPIGIDAPGPGTYERYLAGCRGPTNGSLFPDIQTAVCTQQIDLRPTLYHAMWIGGAGDGEWCVSARHSSPPAHAHNPKQVLRVLQGIHAQRSDWRDGQKPYQLRWHHHLWLRIHWLFRYLDHSCHIIHPILSQQRVLT